jgi:adenylate cyclase
MVSSVIQKRDDHAAVLVELGLRMRAEVSKFSGIHVRIGIHSGEVVAGIIGRKRFTYDVCGDAVNIASRMESYGAINEIQINESTYAEFKNLYDSESRGDIEL